MMLQAPFPWFGGKSRAASEVWARFGPVQNFIEPFFGSGAVLLAAPPDEGRVETVNDFDGLVCNFWRAVQHAPEETADWADQPVNECDLPARHLWLKANMGDLPIRLMADPDFYDAKIAGWWVWGISIWIGGGFCGPGGAGPWIAVEGWDGVKRLAKGNARTGVTRGLPHLGHAGQGVKRQLPHLGGHSAGTGVTRQLPRLGDAGTGVKRSLPHLGGRSAGRGVTRQRPIHQWFLDLQARLKRVRICCGDFERILGPSVTSVKSPCGVFLDPPYSSEAGRDMNLYREDSGDVAHRARAWALEHGDDPALRIALCGYEGEYEMPPTWAVHEWKANGGYANMGDGKGKENSKRERVWFSPHCLSQKGLF